MKSYDQEARAKRDRQWWDELRLLAENDDVLGFYKHYAKYLKWANIISNKRKILHRMAERVVSKG